MTGVSIADREPEIWPCAGGCGRNLPIAVDISRLRGPGEGRKAYEAGQALAYDEQAWDYHRVHCAGWWHRKES
jgi:hypothetical protein